MDCHAFRQIHGDWVDDVAEPRDAEQVAQHIHECPTCARFDTLARRALMVARNAPPIELSTDFSARMALRLAEERRQRIAEHAPSHAEQSRLATWWGAQRTWTSVGRAAAALVLVAGGSAIARSGSRAVPVVRSEAPVFTSVSGLSSFGVMETSVPVWNAAAPTMEGEIVVVSALRPMGGSLLPASDDPLLDSSDGAAFADGASTSVAATAPLWPTAQMAAHAAYRFAAMEFGDVIRPVSMVQAQR
jgi:predicted anti-sigma-YlaC factor YlaD